MPAVVGTPQRQRNGAVTSGQITVTTPAVFPAGIIDFAVENLDSDVVPAPTVSVNGSTAGIIALGSATGATPPGHSSGTSIRIWRYCFVGAAPSTAYTIAYQQASAGESSIRGCAVEDVDQSNPARDVAAAAADAGGAGNATLSATVDTVVGDLVIDDFIETTTTQFAPDASQTVIESNNASDFQASSRKEATGATTTMAWTGSGFNRACALVVVAYREPAGAPDPVQGGSNTTVHVIAGGAGQKSAQGGAVAATNVATTGAGVKHASGGSAATIGASASGAGRKGAAGGAGTAVSVADTGAGVKTGTGGSSALVRALASGAGAKTATGGTGATVQVTATGGGTAGEPPPSGGSNATVQVSASGAGSKTALGGAGSALAVTAAGAGQKHASGGSAATVGVLAVGGGWKATAGGAAVSVHVSATGGGMVGEPEVPPASQTATPPARSFTATPPARSFTATPPGRN